ncbi:hypothetical protein ACFFL4_09425 [Cellulomonas denverensis]|uniref:hypothetical protein n=1 Tax=Cellulomonas denverensis TaxID=264297 RepID=UPI0035E74C95
MKPTPRPSETRLVAVVPAWYAVRAVEVSGGAIRTVVTGCVVRPGRASPAIAVVPFAVAVGVAVPKTSSSSWASSAAAMVTALFVQPTLVVQET